MHSIILKFGLVEIAEMAFIPQRPLKSNKISRASFTWSMPM
ncbi:hypothetical protein B4096_2575 [Heyndrickxia coagulans]|nr:hypothetical protein B4096_2575 [Heyndrickxia coagulans]